MARPARYLTPKVEDFGCVIDLARLRRQGVRTPGQRGTICWHEHGLVRASVCFTLVPAGLRLDYTTQDVPAPVAELIPIVTNGMV